MKREKAIHILTPVTVVLVACVLLSLRECRILPHQGQWMGESSYYVEGESVGFQVGFETDKWILHNSDSRLYLSYRMHDCRIFVNNYDELYPIFLLDPYIGTDRIDLNQYKKHLGDSTFIVPYDTGKHNLVYNAYCYDNSDSPLCFVVTYRAMLEDEDVEECLRNVEVVLATLQIDSDSNN